MILKEKREEADAALEAITMAMDGAETQKGEMEKMKINAAKEKENIQKRKAVIQKELDQVQPVVDEAKKAVGNLQARDLNEIRSLRAPPEVIRDILEGVLKLMGNQDTSWTSMKSFLGQRGVKDKIAGFDARAINTEAVKQVAKLFRKRPALQMTLRSGHLQLRSLLLLGFVLMFNTHPY